MPKKIYDIKPPKGGNKSEGAKNSSKVGIKIKKTASAPRTSQVHHKRGKRSPVPAVVTLVFIVVFLFGLYLYFKLPKAEIAVWPKLETLSFQEKVTLNKAVELVDLAKGVIPAKFFQATKTNSQNFPSTGLASNEGLARGTITVSNKYSPPTPLTLKAGTHFMSNSGKLFKAPAKIVIPAAQKVGGKIIPGSVQVNIEAVEPGPDYNIAPADFSIPGLKGTSFYYNITATSKEPMAGGYVGKARKVTDDDIQGAKDILTQKTIADAMSELKSQIPEDYILLDNAALPTVVSASTQTKTGTVIDQFNYQVAVQANALAFKKSDLDNFVKNYISAKVPDGKTILENSLKTNYSSIIVDISGGKASFNLNFSSEVYQDIDKNSLYLSLLGESAGQVRTTLDNVFGGEISKAEINFWPFWVKSVPNNQKAVNIELKFQ